MATQKKEQRLSFGEKVSYGFGDAGANIFGAMTGSFLTAYYTDTAGIAAAAVGTMMLLARVFDGVTDLAMGAVVDKTKSRFGKARPWLLWTAPLMMIGLILLFAVPSGWSQSGKLVYAYITYIFSYCIVYTANNLPYNALLSRMTLNVQDRASASSVRFVMANLMQLIVNAITVSLVGVLGWTWLAVIYGVVEVILFLISFFGCKEHIDETDAEVAKAEETKIETVPLKEALPAVLKNKYFYLLAFCFLFMYIYFVSTGMLGYYFCNVALNNAELFAICSSAQSIPAIAINFLIPSLVRRFGKRKVMIAGAALMILGSVTIGFAGTSFAVVVFGVILRGLGMGPLLAGVFAMTADVVDYGEWKFGIRSEGLVNSCTSFGMKVGIGLGSAIGSWILAAGKYLEGTAVSAQPASAVAAIRFGYSWFGAIAVAVVLVLVFMINIDKNIVTMQADLEAKHAQG